MAEIRNRDTADLLIAVVDGLKGFPEVLRLPANPGADLYRASAPLLDTVCLPEGVKTIVSAFKPLLGENHHDVSAMRLNDQPGQFLGNTHFLPFRFPPRSQ
jgi:hypothetical protein